MPDPQPQTPTPPPVPATPAAELHSKLAALSPQELDLRRREIVASAAGDYEKLSVEALQELSFIVSILRRRSAGPPKTLKGTTKAKPTIDNLI